MEIDNPPPQSLGVFLLLGILSRVNCENLWVNSSLPSLSVDILVNTRRIKCTLVDVVT